MGERRHDEWNGKNPDPDGGVSFWNWVLSFLPWGNGHTLMADGDGLAGCQAIL